MIDDDSFASVVTSTGGQQGTWLVVNLTAYNSLQEYDLGAAGGEELTGRHLSLEVTDPDGMVVWGIGPDETPGSPAFTNDPGSDLCVRSRHQSSFRHMAKTEGDPPDHVMAIAPIADTAS